MSDLLAGQVLVGIEASEICRFSWTFKPALLFDTLLLRKRHRFATHSIRLRVI